MPHVAILVALLFAQHQHLGPAAGLEGGAFKRQIAAIAGDQEAKTLLPHPAIDRRIGAIEHIEVGQLVEADDEVKLLQGRRPPQRGGELFQHAVIGPLPDRQDHHREVIGKVAVVLEGGENDDVVPALSTLPCDLDAIALQAAAGKKLHNGERDTHRHLRGSGTPDRSNTAGCQDPEYFTMTLTWLCAVIARLDRAIQ